MPQLRRYTDADLRTAVSGATTWSEVHRALGVDNSGSKGRGLIKAACTRTGIDTSHLVAGRRRPACHLSAVDAAYIAGLFDGEGSISFSSPPGSSGRRYPRIVTKITQKDRMILDWVHDVTGVGRVYLKDPAAGCHDWAATHRQAEVFLQAIRPYVKVKLARLDRALAFYGPPSIPR